MVLSILAMESARSIRFLYRHFLSNITEKSLNVFYYVCSYAKVDYSRFMDVTASTALDLVPERLKLQLVFLCIDDTMAAKFGKQFEDVSKLFDHAAHNGCSYLNGHCFVSLMRCVSVWQGHQISYLAVPLGYRMWKKEKSKLELAAPSFMTLRRNLQAGGAGLPSMGGGSPRKATSLSPMNGLGTTTSACTVASPTSSGRGRSLPM